MFFCANGANSRYRLRQEKKCVRQLICHKHQTNVKTHPFTRFVYALGELKLPIFGFVGLECLFYVPVKVNPDLPNPRLQVGIGSGWNTKPNFFPWAT